MDMVAILGLPGNALVLAGLLLLWLSSRVEGEIRCYCNDASCVRTGYMCKSSMGRCFSQLTYERDTTRSAHGCAERLPQEDSTICEAEGDITRAKSSPEEEWPILMCCKEDMCNYMDSIDINIYVSKSNESILKGPVRNSDPHNSAPDDRGGYPLDPSQRDLWFKAAVIAVPIAGGFILILLVLLAVRVLRNDSRRHRQLMQMRQNNSLTRAQLYVADHFSYHETGSGRCNTHSKSNVYPANCTHIKSSSGSGGGSGTISTKSSSIYKDVHIKIDHSKNGYEKIRPISSDGSTADGSCNSVILWASSPGKPPGHKDPPTAV